MMWIPTFQNPAMRLISRLELAEIRENNAVTNEASYSWWAFITQTFGFHLYKVTCFRVISSICKDRVK